MRWTKNFARPSFDLIRIPTGKSLTKKNWTSETRNFPKNVTKIFPKCLPKMLPKISIRNYCLPKITRIFVITKTNGILHGNIKNQRYKQYIIYNI